MKNEDLYNPNFVFDILRSNQSSQNNARDTPSYGSKIININLDQKSSIKNKQGSNKADSNSTLDPEAEADFGDSFGNGQKQVCLPSYPS